MTTCIALLVLASEYRQSRSIILCILNLCRLLLLLSPNLLLLLQPIHYVAPPPSRRWSWKVLSFTFILFVLIDVGALIVSLNETCSWDIAWVWIVVTTIKLEIAAAIIVAAAAAVDVKGASLVAATSTVLGRGRGSSSGQLASFSFLVAIIISSSLALVGWVAAGGVITIVVGSHDEM